MSSQPASMAAISARGGLWLLVSFPDENAVRLIDEKGQVMGEDTSVLEPLGVAVAPKAAFVASGKDGRVDVFRFRGSKFERTNQSLGIGAGEFQRPVAIEVSPLTGQVYVADIKRGDVRIYDQDTYQQVGTVGAGTVTAPCGLAFNSQGTLFISDMMAGLVYRFLADGSYNGRLTRQGSDPGETVRPIGIAVDGKDQVYVVDAFFGFVEQYDATGLWLRNIGAVGRGPGLMQTPLDAVVDPVTLKLFVSDSTDKEIEIYLPIAGQ